VQHPLPQECRKHRAKDFSIAAGDGVNGVGGGLQCAISKSLSAAELAAPALNHCKDIAPGDTIEVHWVHSSCDVTPGKGLGSCLSESCIKPGPARRDAGLHRRE
jgi:hypothetical protein